MLTFRTFGGVALEGPSGPVVGRASQRKRLAVLSLVASAPHRISRDRIVGLLWPEAPPDRARPLLSDALYVLRKALGEDAIRSSGDDLALNPDRVWADVAAFDESLRNGELERAVELYRGPFLEGFHVDHAAPFERWLEAERRRRSREASEALEALARRAADAGEVREAARWWARLSAHDPLNTRVVVRLMDALAAAGDRAGALRHARDHERLLARELGLTPPGELADAVERLRSASGPVRPRLKPDGSEPSAGPDAGAEFAEESESSPDPVPAGGLARRLVAVAALAAVVAGAWLVLDGDGSPGPADSLDGSGRLASPATVVLSPLANRSRDSLLALTVTEALRVDLARSGTIRLMDRRSVRRTLERMERPATAPVDRKTAREIALREGFEAVLAGSVHSPGSDLVFVAELLDAESGELLAGSRAVASDSTEVVDAVERLSRDLRLQIVESAGELREAKRLRYVTTPSLEALKRYSLAAEAGDRGEFERQIALLEEAVELDPEFASAYRILGNRLRRREPMRAARMMTRAFENRARLSDPERYFNDGWYHRQVTGDQAAAAAAFGKFLARFPDWLPGATAAARNMLANIQHDRENYAEAESLYLAAIRSDSSFWGARANLVLLRLDQGRFEAARAALSEFRTALPGHWLPPLLEAAAHSVERDYEAAARAYRTLAESPPARPWVRAGIHQSLGDVAATRGRLRRAREEWSRARKIYSRIAAARPALETLAQQARVEVMVGRDPIRALEVLEAGLERRPLPSIAPLDRAYFHLAEAHAMAGDTERARRLLAAESRKVDPAFRPRLREAARLRVRAWIALSEDRPAEAIRLVRALETAPAFADLGGCWKTCHLPLLGLALEAAGHPERAADAYEAYLDTPSYASERWDPAFLAPVHRRLASLRAGSEDGDAPAPDLGRLDRLWNKADPELRDHMLRAPGPDALFAPRERR